MKENNINNKKSPEQGTTLDPKVKASKPASNESAKPNAAPKDSKKGTKAPKKKHSYIVIGECLAGAAIVITCIGFASCSNPSPVEALATASPTASAKAVSLYDNAKDVTLLDSSGNETADKISVDSVNKSDVNKSDLQDWYFNHVVKDGYKYGILKYTDESGKGIYADSTGIYEGELKEDTATKGYTNPADSDLVYTIDTSKKALTKKASASASAEATASAGADSTSDSGDTASDNDSASSNSGSTASKSASGTSSNSSSSNSSSNKSTNSSKKACTPYTIHHDAVTHQETTYTTVHHDAVTTQQWVQDTAAWDKKVDTGNAVYVCGVCHQKLSTDSELVLHMSNVHGGVGNYWSEPEYTTVHHDATGHYETVVTQAAYDEQVPSGTKTVVDQAAWDETGCK